jgi:hypothetical protein
MRDREPELQRRAGRQDEVRCGESGVEVGSLGTQRGALVTLRER